MSTGLKNSVEARKEGARLLILLMVLFTVMLCSGAARAESDLPLFDAHVHYNREAWEGLTAEAAIAILDRAGVVRALVSSTPDDGTLRLLEQAPDRIVPELRPYRSQSDMGTWTKDPSVAQSVKKLLDAQPNLWVELSMRSDISPGGVLVPAWRDLFLKHPDRFLVGTDTWVNSQWEGMPENLDGFRKWLRQLPPAVAEKIARGNGDRLFSP